MKYFSVFAVLFIFYITICSLVPVNGELTDEEICRQPMIRGKCRALIPRYYYNSEKEECTKFGFGGCGGNENKFDTIEECETKCKGIKAADPTPL